MTRTRLPATREGKTHKVEIADTLSGSFDLYITYNRNGAGQIAEVFLNAGKQGSTLQGLLDGWAIMLSIALQEGGDMERIVDKFSGQSFPPSGQTSNAALPRCTSIFDYVVQYLYLEEQS